MAEPRVLPAVDSIRQTEESPPRDAALEQVNAVGTRAAIAGHHGGAMNSRLLSQRLSIIGTICFAGCAASGTPDARLGTDDHTLGGDGWAASPKVLVIDWDPRLASRGGQRASAMPGYTDPHE